MLSESVFCLLTEDLLIRVLEKLGPDRKPWRLVCKEFLQVKSVTRTSVRILRIEFLLELLEKYCNIETLDLSLCPRIEDGVVSVLLSQGSTSWTLGLKRLVLSRATGLSHDVSHCWGYGDREAATLSCAARLREIREAEFEVVLGDF